MSWKKIWAYLVHYNIGLVASCWNAGIHALKINGALATIAAAAPHAVPAPDLRLMLMIFYAAALWEAVGYFDENPLPVSIPSTGAQAAAGAAPAAASS